MIQQRPPMCLSQLALLKLLSTGKGSKVFLAKDLLTDQHLALKIIPNNRSSSVANVHAEQTILRQLTEQNDSFFLPVFATWHDSANFYLATHYFPGGDMAVELMRCRTFAENRARIYTAELVIALERLHSQNIIHRDLKPSNILFDAAGHLILADFGIARRLEKQSIVLSETANLEQLAQESLSFRSSTRDCGTPLFMSPEQHRGDSYSFEVDYWAVGVILYRMLTGRMPYGNNVSEKCDIAKSVIHDEFSVDDSTTLSSSANDLLRSLLVKDPSNRISVAEMKTHSFFRDIDWNAVELRTIESPWTPYIPPIPSNSRTTITVRQGSSYPPWADPYPDFTWHSNCHTAIDEEIMVKRTNVKKSRSCSRSLFSFLFSRKHNTSLESSVASMGALERNDSRTPSSVDETLCASSLPPKYHHRLDKLASLV